MLELLEHYTFATGLPVVLLLGLKMHTETTTKRHTWHVAHTYLVKYCPVCHLTASWRVISTCEGPLVGCKRRRHHMQEKSNTSYSTQTVRETNSRHTATASWGYNASSKGSCSFARKPKHLEYMVNTDFMAPFRLTNGVTWLVVA